MNCSGCETRLCTEHQAGLVYSHEDHHEGAEIVEHTPERCEFARSRRAVAPPLAPRNWSEWAGRQVERFEALAFRLGARFEIVGTHTSKSVVLPVARFRIPPFRFYVRDNFYDQNLCVLAERPVVLTITELLGGIQEPRDWDWYLGEIGRCRGYTWSYFTDAEMEDPKVLSVTKPHRYGGKDFVSSVRQDRKDRWLRRLVDPEWWSRDWSGGSLHWDGEFGPGVKIFIQYRPYMEGISGVTEVAVRPSASEPYRLGCTEFALALGEGQVEDVIRRLLAPGACAPVESAVLQKGE